MDVISILSGVKNKVLDAKNYDLLKHAYDLQNQNIEQLKNNNEALKESNKLLQERVNQLKDENDSLIKSVNELTQRLSQLENDRTPAGLSKVALAILDLYRQRDTTDLWKEGEIISALNFGKIQIECGIDELRNAKMIAQSMAGTYDIRYSLTVKGKKYLA